MMRSPTFWCPLLMVMSAYGSLHAQTIPRMVRLSFPSTDPAHQMGVTWHSDSDAQQFVSYGLETPDEMQQVAVVSSPLGGGLGFVHSAALTGLEADTTYHYRVGSDDDGWAPHGGSFSFTTGPSNPCDTIKVAALGDVRGSSYLDWLPNSGSQWQNVFDRVIEDAPDFAVIAGDLVEDGNDLAEWNDFFNVGVHHYPFLPVLPAFGNHDMGGEATAQNYEQLYTLPRNAADNEHYYYFRYGNALFISFNTEWDTPDHSFEEQAIWLEQVLLENPATWKVLFFHHPVWTTTPGETALGCVLVCGHPPNENGQNEVLIDLIDRYDIDLVIQSHNHFYERSEPMRAGGSHASGLEPAEAYRGTVIGERDETGRVPSWGSMYVVTGGGGATLVPLSDLGGAQIWAPGQVSRNDHFHHVMITISDLTLDMQVIDTENGDVLDSATITKLEQYRVTACEPAPPLDADEDGYASDEDCNDDNAAIHPGAIEYCGDGIDQDCSGEDLDCSDDGAPFEEGGAPPSSGPGVPPRGCGCHTQAQPSWLPFMLLAPAWLFSRRRSRRV